MAATTLANEPEALLELLGMAKKCEDGGEENVVNALVTGMDDEELIRTIFVLHDTLRGLAGRAKREGVTLNPEGVGLLLGFETDAFIAAFMRFAEEPFVSVMADHIPWATTTEEASTA